MDSYASSISNVLVIEAPVKKATKRVRKTKDVTKAIALENLE